MIFSQGELVMKRYSILFAILALVLASLACQTLAGGGGGGNTPVLSPTSDTDDSQPQPEENNDNTDGGVSGVESEFPIPDGAMNLQDLGGTTNFQVKMSLDEAMKFYKDALTKEDYTERPILTVTSDTTFSMVFDGHKSGKAIVVQGVDMGDGTVNINIRLEDV
jgi:hypothetical protein